MASAGPVHLGRTATRAILFIILSALAVMHMPRTPEASSEVPTQGVASVESNLHFANDDTVVFLGDSLAHQCLYTQYVEDYFYTRYPHLRVHFHNAGVAGDSAGDALLRFQDDVAAVKPRLVAIHFGMNDGGFTRFDQAKFDTYKRNVNSLVDRVGAIGATAVLISPSMFDSRAVELDPRIAPVELRDRFYNEVLGSYGTWLREQSVERRLRYADTWTPLNALTLEQRKTQPDFTFIPDAVHPAVDGHVVMAVAVIKNVLGQGEVSAVVLYRNPLGSWQSSARNGDLSNLSNPSGDDILTFDFKARALPWVLPAEAAAGYSLTQAGRDYSAETIAVRDLQPGRYELRIDNQSIGTYTDAELARGVALQENPKTPQYQQALKVASMNKERNEKVIQPLRYLWLHLKWKRAEILRLQQSASKKEELAKAQTAFLAWEKGFETQRAASAATLRDFEEKIYQSNQPPARRYELRRVH